MSYDYKVTYTFKVETDDSKTLATEIERMRRMLNAMLEFTDIKIVKDYTSCDSSMELIE